MFIHYILFPKQYVCEYDYECDYDYTIFDNAEQLAIK